MSALWRMVLVASVCAAIAFIFVVRRASHREVGSATDGAARRDGKTMGIDQVIAEKPHVRGQRVESGETAPTHMRSQSSRPAAGPRTSDAEDQSSEGRAAQAVFDKARRAMNARGADIRRDEIARSIPSANARRDAGPGDGESETHPDLPEGVRFAASLDGSATTADGREPLIEKNTQHDGADGTYFPADAQLAYANRAGVQGDAGTVAVWVEPVDWDGNDASVHSFFRLNDSGDGSYRFHLLKDSRDLRFQFITDDGESNVRVPIDWWPRGEGHHVAATWDSNVLRLYVDGVAVGEQSYTGTLKVAANVPGWWGSNTPSGTVGAGAILKDTMVSDHPIDEAELQRMAQPDASP